MLLSTFEASYDF